MSVPDGYTAAVVGVAVDSIDIDCDNVRTSEGSRSEKYQQHLHQRNNPYRFAIVAEEQQFTAQCTPLMSVQSADLKKIQLSIARVDQKNAETNIAKCELMLDRTVTATMDREFKSSLSLDGGSTQQSEKQQAGNKWEVALDDKGNRFGTPGAACFEYQKYTEGELQNLPNNNNSDIDNNHMGQNQMMEEPSIQEENYKKTVNNNSNVDDDYHLKMSTDELYTLLKECGVLQDKYHTVLLLPKESKREVTAGGRDGSAYVLRCLKIWYELPSDVLFSAMSLVDRFLDRMTVRPKHMACMSVASFYLAIKQLNLKCVLAEDLVTISQCGCTAGDLERMANVIASKLGVQMGHSPVTSVNCLRIYYALFHHLARDIGGDFYEFYQQYIKLEELENRLEVLLCDVRTTTVAPSTLALVLISLHLDFHIKASYTLGKPELKLVFEYILFLQKFINVPDRVFTCGFSVVSDILTHYNGQNKQPYKQRLVWKLSSRTLRLLRPTNRFSSVLPTIQEGISNTLDEGCRLRTDSSSSEEEEDWPTSHIIPIFEQC